MPRAIALLCCLVSALLLFASPARAATFTVATYAQLVSAINAANANSQADTINITANIRLEASLPQITSNVTINGGGSIIDGDGKYRPFNVSSAGTLTLNNLTIDRAYIARASGTTPHGASIRSLGALNLDRVVVRNGKTDPDTSSGQHSVGAGGIYVSGNTKISNSAIYNNRSRGEGTGIRIAGGSVSVVNSSIFGNESSHGRGGGIYLNAGTLNLYHSTVTANKPNTSGVSNFGNQTGGGVRAFGGTFSMSYSIVWGNVDGSNLSNCHIASGATVGTLSNNVVGGGSDASCTTNADSGDPLLDGPSVHGQGNFLIPRPGGSAVDTIGNADCSTTETTDQRGRARPYPVGGNCDKGAIEWYPPPPPSARSRDEGGSPSASEQAAPPPLSTCLTLDGLTAFNINPQTQCQRIDAVQIANPHIRDGDFVDAVDVWGWVTPASRICFEAAGSAFTFIDTAAMPRSARQLAAFLQDGYTCTDIDGPGMLILLPGDPPAAAPATAALGLKPDNRRSLSNCMVTASAVLHLRDAPAGAAIGYVSKGWKLTAMQRTDYWFQVDRLGVSGWIFKDYVTTDGTCD